jgi:O-succinylbenzoic acid--CoA ligase
VLVRGAVLADGYRVDGGLEPLCDDDGWFRTNDLGRFDGDRLVIAGRRDDVVISGGVNVSTAAVARLLRQHAEVADAAVIGVDDAEWGQRLVAFVVAHDPASPPAFDALRAHVRAGSEPAWVPRQVLLVPALPRTALGKIDRTVLRTRVGPLEHR